MSKTLDLPAPPLQVSHWFNTPGPLSLEALRDRVVALHAFQMLCPGCVAHGLPQPHACTRPSRRTSSP